MNQKLLCWKMLEFGRRRERDFLAVRNSLNAGIGAEKSRFLIGEHQDRSISGSQHPVF